MMNKQLIIFALLILIALATIGGLSIYKYKNKTEITEPTEYIILMKNGIFDPAEIQISVGDKITFINNDKKDRYPASDPHPTHTNYSELDPKQPIIPGSSWSLEFSKTGTWGYHDHLSPEVKGVIIVK